MYSPATAVFRFKGSSKVWALPLHASIRSALHAMHDNSIGSIVVIGASDRVCGVVSERERLQQIASDGELSARTTLSDLVTGEPCTVRCDTTARECFELMAAKRVRYLPIVAGGAVHVLVSIGDIVRALVDDQRFAIEQLLGYIAGSYGPLPDTLAVATSR